MNPAAHDRRIADAVLTGDRDAFRVFVERESKTVIEACSRILRDPVEAQDAAQDAFVRAFTSLATYRGDGPFGAWVRRIAVRVAIARLAVLRDVVELTADGMGGRDGRSGSAEDPEARVLAAEDRAAIIDAIAALPASQRDTVLLRFYGDLSLDEISRLTSHPVGTVKSRLSRGVARLRDDLESESAR